MVTGYWRYQMGHRSLPTLTALAVGMVAMFVASVSLKYQTATAASGKAAPAAKITNTSFRTPWGDPDLQGTWDNATNTPLERPRDLSGKETLTPEEVAALDEESATSADRTPRPGDTGTYNAFW